MNHAPSAMKVLEISNPADHSVDKAYPPFCLSMINVFGTQNNLPQPKVSLPDYFEFNELNEQKDEQTGYLPQKDY
jgi:hypothetical protein